MYELVNLLRENDVELNIRTENFVGINNVIFTMRKGNYAMSHIVDVDLIEMNAIMTLEQYLIDVVNHFLKEECING